MASTLAPKKPVPPPSAVGAPVEPKAKKGKVTKVDHPALADGKLETAPADFDPKVHKPLKKKDFKDEPAYLEFIAAGLDKKAAALREQATKIRTLGNTASSSKVKTLMKMQERMAELMATLKQQGIDVDTLLSTK